MSYFHSQRRPGISRSTTGTGRYHTNLGLQWRLVTTHDYCEREARDIDSYTMRIYTVGNVAAVPEKAPDSDCGARKLISFQAYTNGGVLG